MKKTTIYILILVLVILGGIFFVTSIKNRNGSENPLPGSVVPVDNEEVPVKEPEPLFNYIEIVDGCNHAYENMCVNLRAGPGTNYDVIEKLRIGIVLRVEPKIIEGDEHDWYKIVFDNKLQHPERIKSDWYVAVDNEAIRHFYDEGERMLDAKNKAMETDKRIVVDLSKQMLYAYEGNTLFLEEPISAGIEINPTPVGTYTISRKMPSRYMQGPIPDVSDDQYDLPGVPWVLYFTSGGAAVHGAYWHNNFGFPMSHGCINQSPELAKKLYYWAPLGTPVTIQR